MSVATDSLFKQGLSFHKRGDLERAKACYRQVLAENPAHAGAWHFLGVVALLQNDIPKAREDLEKALELCLIVSYFGGLKLGKLQKLLMT